MNLLNVLREPYSFSFSTIWRIFLQRNENWISNVTFDILSFYLANANYKVW